MIFINMQYQIINYENLRDYIKSRIKGLLSYLVPAHFGAFLISYLVDQASFVAIFQSIYRTEFTLANAITTSLIIFSVYIFVTAFVWYLKQFNINILDERWVGWTLFLQSLVWLFAPLGPAGFVIIYLFNSIFPAVFFIPLVTIGIAIAIVRLKPDLDISKFGLFPTNLDPLVAVITVAITLFLKGLFLSLFIY